jgi:hypothetical protein
MEVSGKKASKQFSSSTTSIASDEDHQVYCQPCDEEGTRLSAHGYCTVCKEHLCKTCFKVHKKLKSTKHHKVLDATSMPKVLHQTSTPIHTSQSDELTTPCYKHPKEINKFYCHDHTELLCSVCVTLGHQAIFCKVDYIPDISADIIDSIEYLAILKALNTTFDHFQRMVKDVKQMTVKSNRSLKDALKDINMFRKEINQRLDELVRQVVHVAKVTEQENNSNITLVETSCEEITKSLKISLEKVKKLNTSKQANTLFTELKLAENLVAEVEKTALQLSTYDVKEHNFQANETILTNLNTERSLGTLIQKTLHKERKPVQIKSRHTLNEGKNCVKTSQEKTKCWVTGMTLLSPDLLIITDYNNIAVKMVDTSNQSWSDQLQLDDAPWDITQVSSIVFAVTIPDKQTIQLISIASNKLKTKLTVKVGGDCHGIGCYHSKLVVSYLRPAKLQILDMNGNILKTIDGENIFQYPCYITCNRSSIYVSDCGMKTVTRLNWQGHVIGSYSGMSDPRRMSLSDDGTVFVCDWALNVIKEVAGDCSAGKVVLENLYKPSTVCLCGETKKLYYSCRSFREMIDSFLYIYKLS